MSCLFCKGDIKSKEKLDNKVNHKRAQILALVFTKLCNLLQLKLPNRNWNNWNFKENAFPFCRRCRIEISKLCSLQDQIQLMEQQILRIIAKLYMFTIESDFISTANVSQKTVVNDQNDENNTFGSQKIEADAFRGAILRQIQANLILRDCRSEFPDDCHSFTYFKSEAEETNGIHEDVQIDVGNISGAYLQYGDDVKFDWVEEKYEVPELLDGDEDNNPVINEDRSEESEVAEAMDYVEEKYESEDKNVEGHNSDEEKGDVDGIRTDNKIEGSESENTQRFPEVTYFLHSGDKDTKFDSVENMSESPELLLGDEGNDTVVNQNDIEESEEAEKMNNLGEKCESEDTIVDLTYEPIEPSPSNPKSSQVQALASNPNCRKPNGKMTLIGKNLYSYKGYKMELQEENAICLTCGKKFKPNRNTFRTNFQNHINKVHLKNVNAPTGRVFLLDASTKKYTMDGFEFTPSSDDLGFLCLTCNKVCTVNKRKRKKDFGDIKDHIRKHHMLSYKGICPTCGKMKNDLRSHVLNAHLQKICEICGQAFSRSGITQHLKTHQKPSEYLCEQCGKKFCKKQSLESHMKMHASKKEFVCETCGQRFNFKNVLETHIASKHAKTRPFACNQCDWTFGVKFLLNRHIRQVHEGKKPPPPKKRKKVVVEPTDELSTEDSSTSSCEDSHSDRE